MSLSKTDANKMLNERISMTLNRATAIIDKILEYYSGDSILIKVESLEIQFDKGSKAYGRVINAILTSYSDGGWSVTYTNGTITFQ